MSAASIAVWDDDRVLLIQRAIPPYEGFWTLPGGRLEEAETPREAAIRELCEETGLVVTDAVFVDRLVVGAGSKKMHLSVFTARFAGGRVRGSSEVSRLGWYRRPQIAGLDTTPGLAGVIGASSNVLANR
ncbi:MAG: NUDIX domain-containing protein [Alphaproteobacteria bacterium]|nr:NUDIX domain-containing protein [Alphaproteobacteria bacterium]